MGYDTIHETVIKDIVDSIKDLKDADIFSDKFKKKSTSDIAYSSSLTKATKGLILEFPVLISKANHIESAGIVAKAYEAKFVTLLQIAFSAINISNAENAIEYVKQFHTNLDYSKMSLDDFMDIMDSYAVKEHSNGIISNESYNMYKAVMEDMKNLSYYFDEDIKESSLEDYKVMKNYGSLRVVKEAINSNDQLNDEINNIRNTTKDQKNFRDKNIANKKEERDNNIDNSMSQADLQNMKLKRKDSENRERDINNREKEMLDRAKREERKLQMDQIKSNQDILSNNIISSDIKKANELTPTMMVINFVQPINGITVGSSAIIGVKAKLYEVEPTDVINKLITKHVDNNLLLKLVKVSTREISFVRDFLLAIDDAKLDALSKSKKGSTNKLFKVLERRALHGKIRKNLKQKDYCKAITSLVISQEEVEELLKNNIDVSNPKIIRPIMEKLNLISFAIIDESSESVKFLFDTGDDVYETIPLSKLEREQKDGMSKKVINLMAKMNR